MEAAVEGLHCWIMRCTTHSDIAPYALEHWALRCFPAASAIPTCRGSNTSQNILSFLFLRWGDSSKGTVVSFWGIETKKWDFFFFISRGKKKKKEGKVSHSMCQRNKTSPWTSVPEQQRGPWVSYLSQKDKCGNTSPTVPLQCHVWSGRDPSGEITAGSFGCAVESPPASHLPENSHQQSPPYNRQRLCFGGLESGENTS